MQNLTDTELLDAYVAGEKMPQGDTCGKTPGEAAFGELMRRHGALVYRACHRLLKDPHEAEDASQAVFVVLARKAGKLRKGDLSAWLYRVAHHVAAETVRRRMRRTGREDAYAATEAIQVDEFAINDAAESDVLGLLDTALLSLPERYRQAVILRYLQNHSEKDAAQLASVPLGTLSGRASQGIAMLRQRLSKRGVAVSGAALAGLLTSEASAAAPEILLPSILAAVKTAVATGATATTATSTAAMLAKGAMKAMFIAKVKLVAAVAAAVVVTGTAVPVGIAVAQAVSKEAAGGAALVAQEVAQEVAQRKAAEQPSPIVASVAAGNAATNALKPGDEITVGLGNGVKLTLCWCPAGSFVMGSPTNEWNEVGRFTNETQHRVTLTKGFWMGKYEVTQAQWALVMSNNPSHFKGTNLPVDKVSWDDCQEFVRKLNAFVPGGGFRLPTEAEWEYACRAGTTNAYAGDLDEMAWYDGKSTHEVGGKKPNAWNLYDMHGNVWEFCQDWGGEYPDGAVTNPVGPSSGDSRVGRGGGWNVYAKRCRSANRSWCDPGDSGDNLGFRLARTP